MTSRKDAAMSKRDDTTISIGTPDGGMTEPVPLAVFGAALQAVRDSKKDGADFALEPSEPEGGRIPWSVIDELRHARAIAKDYVQGYSDAAKAQAEKYKLKPSALKRYIAALEDDKLDDLDAETNDLEKLIGQ